MDENERMMDESWCVLLGDFFTTFAHRTRMQMFCALQYGRQTVSEIAEHAGVSIQNASQHLRLMRDKGAVQMQKEGQHVYYSVADPRFLEAARLIREALAEGIQRKAQAIAPAAVDQPLRSDAST